MDSQNYQALTATLPPSSTPMYNPSSMSKRKDGRFQAAKRMNGKTIFGYSTISQEDAHADLARKISEAKLTPLNAESTLHEVAMNVWYPRVQNLSKNTIKRYESSYVMYIRDDLDISLSLQKLATWYAMHSKDPNRHPMTGVCTYHDGTIMFKREHTKSDCFLIHKDRPAPQEQGETK